MKTKSIITGLFASVLAIAFTSCSTSVEIAKRTFNKGYYVNITKKTKPSPAVNAQVENTVVKNQEIASKSSLTSEVNTIVISEPVASNHPEPMESHFEKSVQYFPTASVEEYKAASEMTRSERRVLAKNIRKGIKENAFQLRGDAPAIVYILLCIFIPPVAVGIKDDWGSRFWLDLLLTFLFYFPGMIYAFIVCFG